MASVAKDFKVRYGIEGTVLKSTVASGTAPLQVASNTLVTNLNADLLDGNHASAFVVNPMTSLGDMIYGGAAGATTRLPNAGTTNGSYILREVVSGGAAQAPAWLALASGIDTFLGTPTSANLASAVTDETGSGALVFGTSPTFTTSVIAGSSTMAIFNTTATTVNAFGAATALSLGAGTGTTTVNNSLTVTGNLTVNGTTTTINSTVMTVDDPIFVLGGDTAPSSDDNLDRGIEFRWHNGTVAKLGFFGYDDSTGYLTFIPDATDTSGVLSGTVGSTNIRLASSLTIKFDNGTTEGTDQYTFNNGAAKTINISGGTGVSLTESAGSVTIANTGVTSITFGTTGLTPNTGTTGAVTVAGTLVAANGGTGQSSYTVGDLLYASSTTALSKLADVATGSALISGGVGVAPSWGKIGLTTHVSGTLPIANGGTGQTTQQAAINALAGATTSGQYLRGNGTNVVMSAIQASDIPTLAQVDFANSTKTSATVTIAAALGTNTMTFSTTTYRSAIYEVQAISTGGRLTKTTLVIEYDGTDIMYTEYGVVDSTAGAAISAPTVTWATNTATITFTDAANTTNTVVKADITYIKA